MVLLIDAYNVILGPAGVVPRSPGDLAAARARLAEQAYVFLARRFRKAILVFDGEPGAASPPPPSARVQAVFAGAAKGSADRWIKGWISEHAAKGRFAVVSSDREVASWARRHGGRAIPSAEFLEAASPERGEPRPREPGEKEAGLAPGAVGDWMRWFGLEAPKAPPGRAGDPGPSVLPRD